MIGNGTSDTNRSNAFGVYENGKVKVQNSLIIGDVELTAEKLKALLNLVK
jgi:hypothetical protein